MGNAVACLIDLSVLSGGDRINVASIQSPQMRIKPIFLVMIDHDLHCYSLILTVCMRQMHEGIALKNSQPLISGLTLLPDIFGITVDNEY